MPNETEQQVTAFCAYDRFISGSLTDVALAVKAAFDDDPSKTILVFADETGAVIDLNLGGTVAEVRERISRRAKAADGSSATAEPEQQDHPVKSRGRPRLGVVSREVTLLPRHWDWLETQSGGASATLRRLVDDARKISGPIDRHRTAQDAAHRFLTAIAGDAPRFEDAMRAFFANEREQFEAILASWSTDIHQYAVSLAYGATVKGQEQP